MEDSVAIVLIVLMGSLIMFLLVMVIITFSMMYTRRMNEKDAAHRMEVKNKELEMLRAVIDAGVTEREKIALNIHDEVGPLLSTMKLNLARNMRALGKGTLTGDQLEEDLEFLNSVIDNVRTVSHDLSPQYLMKFGLVRALTKFVENMEGGPGIDVEVSIREEDLPITRTLLNHIYCVVIELINNLIKHDSPSKIMLRITEHEDHALIELIHNGKGISQEEFLDFAANSEGLGLTSMQSRVLIFNGILGFEKGEDESRTDLSIPFKR